MGLEHLIYVLSIPGFILAWEFLIKRSARFVTYYREKKEERWRKELFGDFDTDKPTVDQEVLFRLYVKQKMDNFDIKVFLWVILISVTYTSIAISGMVTQIAEMLSTMTSIIVELHR